ncbi:hypothetical protein HDIA_1717 [Hartmannibacter diazotrophicus]|uniref:Uncharacterized protein n=1 Tax=Hartmannibacter diazotrophicus TaxID=1482074 RepID=A0A2C9D538_9HYPH|nr:hypothetical protein HDIA_1717 [Hartmannibacter diazotrophicus]
MTPAEANGAISPSGVRRLAGHLLNAATPFGDLRFLTFVRYHTNIVW